MGRFLVQVVNLGGLLAVLKRKITICCACSNNSSVLLSEKFEQEQQVSKHAVKYFILRFIY